MSSNNKFIRLTVADLDLECWVRPESIRMMVLTDKHTRLRFMYHGDAYDVKETPDEIMELMLASQRQSGGSVAS